jgi:cyclic pyranopterin phosphate synthase
MPTNNTKWFDDMEVLTFNEIDRLVSIFVDLGIERIRITGGEPLIRPNLESLINSIALKPEIKSISMTTNGLLLENKVEQLVTAGLSSVNISIDTFKENKFKMITGVEGVNKVFSSIMRAKEAGLEVKINTVIIRGWNDDEIVDFASFAKEENCTVRFIEFMPLDGTGIWRPNLVFSKAEMMERINVKVGKILTSCNDNKDGSSNSEPATIYSFAEGKGAVGFIPSITEPFCTNCDRARITSDGRFLTCLFDNQSYDLKGLLRSGATDEDIIKYIIQSMTQKPEGIIRIIKNDNLKPALNLMHTIGG